MRLNVIKSTSCPEKEHGQESKQKQRIERKLLWEHLSSNGLCSKVTGWNAGRHEQYKRVCVEGNLKLLKVK